MIKLYFDNNIPYNIQHLIQYYPFEMSCLEDCDYIISCKFNEGNINTTQKIQNSLNSYVNIPKKVIVFLISDFADDFTIPYNVLLFRTSIYKSTKKFNEFLLPYIWENFLSTEFITLEKSNYPIVGFCGRVDKYREKLINMIKQDEYIKCNFILKQKFWGGDPHNTQLVNDFRTNIEQSHFTICNRGNGNYAMRFYQTLSLGRIPVLVDYDHIFPFENEIPWNDICIIGKNEQDVINKIKKWWKEKDILSIHKKCRTIFENYLCNKTFFTKIMEGFYDNKNKDNLFSFPLDFNSKIYGKYIDLEKLNFSQLIKHYMNNGIIEKRIYKLPYDFNVNSYRMLNNDLQNLNYDQLIKHFINFGIKENRQYINSS